MSLLRRINESQKPAGQPEDATSKLRELRVRRQSVPTREAYPDIKTRVQNQLIAEFDPTMDMSNTAEVRATIEEMFNQILNEESIVLGRGERLRLF